MNIAILDGEALNPGDFSWAPLENLGELTVYDRTPADLVIERAQSCEAVFTNKVAFDADLLEQLPQLRYIGVMATGYDKIAIEAAKEKGIVVTNVAGYGSVAVAQHTFALLLELTNRVGLHSTSVAKGDWDESRGWCYWKKPIQELHEQTFGIIGMGDIGQKVSQIAQAFGMRVIYHTRRPASKMFGEDVTLDEVFSQSDILSLHCPLNPDTECLVNQERLSSMKEHALLLNTARGQLIDEQALAEALELGIIAGAGLDVLSQEPPPSTNPLLQAPNCLITPHNAWGSFAARQRLLNEVALNFKAFLDGEERNKVN